MNRVGAIAVREGHGGRDSDQIPDHCYTVPLQYEMSNPECLVLGKDREVVSQKGAVVDREGFERMKSEYYQLRRWDVATGLQTRRTLEDLGWRILRQTWNEEGCSHSPPAATVDCVLLQGTVAITI